jgi:hypothetical protein
MSPRNWSDDDELVLDLRDALRQTPVDDRVIAAARAAYEWRTANLDLELAVLRYDSDACQPASVRGPLQGSHRTLAFGTDELGVEIEFSEAGMEGQLIPPEPGTVQLLTVDAQTEDVSTDELGCFRFPARNRGPVRLLCDTSGGQFITEWITA